MNELQANEVGRSLKTRRLCLLVVDDNVDAAEALAIALQLHGHEVHTAHDGERAVELTRELEPECVFMDIAMPRLDGLAATRCIRHLPLKAQPLIIAVTAWGRAWDRFAADEAGIDVHLSKPIEWEVIQQLLAGKLER